MSAKYSLDIILSSKIYEIKNKIKRYGYCATVIGFTITSGYIYYKYFGFGLLGSSFAAFLTGEFVRRIYKIYVLNKDYKAPVV